MINRNRFSTCLFCLFLLFSLASTLFSQTPCSLDNSWAGDGRLVSDGSRIGEHILIQADGKVLVACTPFGSSYSYIRRFNTDGTVDNSYGTGGKFTVQVAERRTGINGMVEHNGNLYICGTTTTDIGGTNTYVYAAAIAPNGTGFVNTFGTNGIKSFNTFPDLYKVSAIEVDASGNIFLGGLEGLDNIYVLKMTSTGALSGSFNGSGIQYAATGNNDHWYEVNDLVLDKSGKVLIAGKKYKANNGSTITPFWNTMVMRFTASGAFDNSFANGGIGLYNSNATNFDEANNIHVTPNDEYILTGNTYDGNDYDYNTLKLTNSGTVDMTFGTNGWVMSDLFFNDKTEGCFNSALLPDGRILHTGNHGTGDTVYFSMLMLNPDGSRDKIFAPDGVFTNIFNQNNNSSNSALAVDPGGKIYLGGYTRTCVNGNCGLLYMALSRYHNTFGNTTGLGELLAEEVELYPNPAPSGGTITLSGLMKDKIDYIELLDLTGKEMSVQPQGGGQYQLPELAPGVYLCRMISGQHALVKKLLIR